MARRLAPRAPRPIPSGYDPTPWVHTNLFRFLYWGFFVLLFSGIGLFFLLALGKAFRLF